MKKILSFLALALAFTACQTDPAVESVGNDGLVDVVLTVDAPELGVTRADGDTKNGHNSAFGAIDFMTDADWANYDLRYILEVYDANDNGTGEPIYRERLVNCLDKYAPTTFALRLVPNRDYKFVVFADFVAEGNAELTEPADKLTIADLYYNTADLRNISAITTEATWGAMNEVRDAYFVSKNVTITTGLNETLTLTRPFAKLRVIATDLDYIAGYSKPGYVKINYHTEKVYKSFNAVNGQLNADEMTGAELEYAYNVSKTIPYSEGYDAYSTNQTLFTDYLLAVEGQQTTVNFEMFVYEDNTMAKLIHSQDFSTQIPIQRNHLTTIIGDLLTTQANITVDINDDFVDEFVKGWGDDNATMINFWEAGEYNTATGDYEFVVKGENDFKVTINGAAVSAGKLTVGNYVLAQDAEGNNPLTFTVEALQANVTTRALAAVNVIGGDMKVAESEKGYAITLDLVLQFEESKDVRHAIYTYEGAIIFGAALETPVLAATVEGNTVTLTWEAVEGATKYLVAMNDEAAEETTELTKVYEGLAWETTYRFSVKAVNETLESAVNTIEAIIGEEPVVETYKMYFNNLAEWSDVYAHIWANEGEDLGLEPVDWPGRKLTETETIEDVTYYVFQLPAEATGKTVNVVFNNGDGTQTKDLSGVATKNLFFDNYVEPAQPSNTILYLKPNANWKVDGARFAAYFFGNGETWVDMTLVEGETDIYSVVAPVGYPNVIFCRMSPTAAANNWNNKWNQTADLKVPTDGTNFYTVKEGTWDNGGGTWGVYAPAVVDPVALATPEVKAEVAVNVITLTWEAIEGASHYTVQVDDDVEEVVNDTTYTFEGDYDYEYTFTVKAIAADTTKNLDSEAAVVTAKTEAEPVVEEKILTVAEFLALTDVVPSDATADEIAAAPMYTLKGTITAVANSTYGNFDLTDETGTVLIYGLMSPDGATNKYWATSGAKLGDDITVKTIRTEYGNSPQGKNAWFVELATPGTYVFWTFDATSVSFAAEAGEKNVNLAIYNTDAEVKVESNNTQFSAVYADGVLTVTALENTTSEKIEGVITVTCGTLSQEIAVSQTGVSTGDKEQVTATLTFNDKSKRTEFSTTSQTWVENGVTFVNEKNKSTNAVADYSTPVRCYQGSMITVSVEGEISTIVFDCNSSSYATALQNSVKTGVVSVSSDKVTVALNGESSFTIEQLTAQVRIDAVSVTYLK